MPLIKCEVEVDLKCSKNCILTEEDDYITDINCTITSTKRVTSSINGKINVLENIKQGFKRTISWNKCRSEITKQPKTNNLDYLTDATSRNINRFF